MHDAVHTTSDGDDAAPSRWRFRGMEYAAQDGIRAVRTDEEIALDAIAASQVECHAIALLREAGRLAAECDRLEAHGVEQGAVERRPQRDNRRAAADRLGLWQLGTLQHRAIRTPHFAVRWRV